MTVQGNAVKTFVWDSKILRWPQHGKVPLRAISLSNGIIRLNTAWIHRSYILTGNVKFKSILRPAFYRLNSVKTVILPLSVKMGRTTKRHAQNLSETVLGNSSNINSRAPKRQKRLTQLLSTDYMLSSSHDKLNNAKIPSFAAERLDFRYTTSILPKTRMLLHLHLLSLATPSSR